MAPRTTAKCSAVSRSRTPARLRSCPATATKATPRRAASSASAGRRPLGRPRKVDAAAAARAASAGRRGRERPLKVAAAAAAARGARGRQPSVGGGGECRPKPGVAPATAPTPPPPRGQTQPQRPPTPLQRAGAALKPAGLVGRLPCREVEQDRTLAHLRGALRQGGSEQVLYIAGMPGTGKTAAVLQLVRELQDDGGAKGRPLLTFVHVNAMRLGTPGAVFGELLSQLPGRSRRKCPAAAAQREVQRYFADRGASDPVVLLLIDEIDHLVTRSQNVLYTVFDLLSSRARLVVAAISNTMDLPERMLPRVASRFEIVRVDFWPYTRDQIHKILCERLRSHDASQAFSADALRLCAARVAAGSGDVRKALQLCRRALELRQGEAETTPTATGPRDAVASGDEIVGTQHVNLAAKDLLYANPAATAIAGLSDRTRRVLVAMLLELRSNKDSDVLPLGRLASRYARMFAILEELEPPSSGSHAEDAAFIVERLTAMSILARKQQPRQVGRGTAGLATGCTDGAAAVANGPLLSLGGGLDVEDLAATLLNAETDLRIQGLIRD